MRILDLADPAMRVVEAVLVPEVDSVSPDQATRCSKLECAYQQIALFPSLVSEYA